VTAAGRSPRLVYRPDFRMDAEMGTRLGPVRVNGTLMTVGKRYSQPDQAKSLGSFERIGANVLWESDWSGFRFWIKGEVNNLAGRNITFVEGYPMPGREFRVTFGLDG